MGLNRRSLKALLVTGGGGGEKGEGGECECDSVSVRRECESVSSGGIRGSGNSSTAAGAPHRLPGCEERGATGGFPLLAFT